MDEIWAKCLILGTKRWDEVPVTRRETIKEILRLRVETNQINEELFERITK